MTRTARILATAATVALLAGAALAQGPRFGGAGPADDGAVGPMHERIADALGITAEELTAMHEEGLTLVEIAESLGVELDDLPMGPAQAGASCAPTASASSVPATAGGRSSCGGPPRPT